MSSYIGKININNTEYPIAQSLFGTSNTTANTATKVVTCADFDTLISGIVINVYFTYANTESSISLNVNSTGNKTVYVDSNSSILWDAGATKSFVYYNNQWRLINPTSVGTTYSTATTTTAGLMSTDDKIKLNGITTGASTYAAGTGLSLSGTTFNHTNSITASSVGSSVATSGATLDVPYAKYDAQGHITAKGTHVHTIGSLAASAITSGTFATARIPNLPTSIITSGTFATARIPNLPTSIITSGTFSTARLPVSTSVGNDNNLPTGAAVQSYVTGLGYEANQNAFTTVKVGTTDLVADSKTDTLTITAGNNITLTPTASSDSFSIAATNTTYAVATTAANGLMSATDKATLDGLISSGGEVNQNAFSNVVVGSSTVAADQKTDTLTLVSSGSVSLSANTSTDTITISGTNTTYGTATTAAAGLMSAEDKIKIDKTIHQLSTLSTVSADDQIAIYDVSNNTTGKSTLATAIEKAGFVPKHKDEDGDETNIINNSYGARIGHYSSDDWNYIMSIGSLTTANGSTVMREGIEFQWQKPDYDWGDWWINRVILGQDGIKVNLDFGDINITSTNSTKVSPQITASNLAQIKIGNASATSAFCVHSDTIGLYDTTHANWIIRKDTTAAGNTEGAATTFYGTATKAQELVDTVPISKGGTGATTVENARAALGFGNAVQNNGSSKSVSNNTVTELQNVALTPGTYFVYFGTTFSSNSSGLRQINFNSSSSNTFQWDRYTITNAPPSGDGAAMEGCRVITISTNTTYRLWAKQTSGSSLTCYPYIGYIKLA